MSNKISTSYQVTSQDRIEAQQLYMRNSKDFLFLGAAAILYLALILLSIRRFEDPDFLVLERYLGYYSSERANEELYVLLYTCSFAFILFFGRLFPKLNPLAYWNTKKDLQKNFVKQEARQITITEEGIAIASQNFRERHQWQAITKTAENTKIFLLYHSRDKEFTVVPKRIFNSEAELIEFRDLLNNKNA